MALMDETTRGRALERLRTLVGMESPSRDVTASRAITDVLAGWFETAGATVERVPAEAGVHLVMEVAGAGARAQEAPLLLIGHSDTVWPRGTLDGDVPWGEVGDTVRGPGVYDMKSGLVIMLAAIELLQGRSHRPVRIVVTCDEEVGSPTSKNLLRQVVEGVDGAIGFESPHPDGALKVGRRGSTRVRIDVTGRAAHAALDPGRGISAIDELVDQLLAIRGIIARVSEDVEVLCNSGTISGGTRANVVAAHAEAELGLRFIDADSEHRVLAVLDGLTPVREGAVVTVETLSHRPAWLASAADRALLERVAAAGAPLGLHVTGRPAAGAGDTNLVGSLGVPTVDGFGPLGGGAHAASEHILLHTLYERVELLAAVLG
jgi:glutamate carboxypeptidase